MVRIRLYAGIAEYPTLLAKEVDHEEASVLPDASHFRGNRSPAFRDAGGDSPDTSEVTM